MLLITDIMNGLQGNILQDLATNMMFLLSHYIRKYTVHTVHIVPQVLVFKIITHFDNIYLLVRRCKVLWNPFNQT